MRGRIRANADAGVAACNGLVEARVEADLTKAAASDAHTLNVAQLGRRDLSDFGGARLGLALPRCSPFDLALGIAIVTATSLEGGRAILATVEFQLPLLGAVAAVLSRLAQGLEA